MAQPSKPERLAGNPRDRPAASALAQPPIHRYPALLCALLRARIRIDDTHSYILTFTFCCTILRVPHSAAFSWGGRQISAKNRITVNLEDAEYRALQQIAARSDRSLAWLGRRAIRDLLQREYIQLTLELQEEDTITQRSNPI